MWGVWCWLWCRCWCTTVRWTSSATTRGSSRCLGIQCKKMSEGKKISICRSWFLPLNAFEYHSVSPLVWIGTSTPSPPLPKVSVSLPGSKRGGHIRLRVRRGGGPNSDYHFQKRGWGGGPNSDYTIIPRKASLPIPTFMYLWAIYMLPRSVHLFYCSKIGGPIVGINKSLTDTWMQELGARPRSFLSGNK